ncbi:MAG: hypothetical protein RLZZ117_2729 [Cyanobacteriota bacterium]|jgi:hypothetical protein
MVPHDVLDQGPIKEVVRRDPANQAPGLTPHQPHATPPLLVHGPAFCRHGFAGGGRFELVAAACGLGLGMNPAVAITLCGDRIRCLSSLTGASLVTRSWAPGRAPDRRYKQQVSTGGASCLGDDDVLITFFSLAGECGPLLHLALHR